MSAGAAVIHKQNKLIQVFNEIGAKDAEHAIFIERFGIRRSYVFNRMVLRGVFIESEPDKFYIDNDTVPVFIEQRRRRAFIALGVVLLIGVCFYLFHY
jgi:hypothetical protein